MSSSSSSSKTPTVSQAQALVGLNQKYQYRLVNNNRLILLANRQSIFNQLLTNRHNPSDNFCLYLHRYCLQNRLEGFNYCIRHILYDKNAPFRQCSFINSNTNKRCPNAARRLDRRDATYCPWHTKKKNLDQQKKEQAQVADSPKLTSSDDTPQQRQLKRKLEDLEHYCPETHDHRRKDVPWELPEDKCITASKSLRDKMNESISRISSTSDDELANITLSETLNLDLVDSDNESAESYMDDPLRHAGVYTAEEIAHVLRDKMLRLQTVYINLLNNYRYILKNKMRDYHANLKTERSILNDPTRNVATSDPIKEESDYKVLKAMHKYHNISGVERVIKIVASAIRRSLVEEQEPPLTPQFPTCTYLKDTGLCNQQCIPLSGYCKEHILFDPTQILYRPCAGGLPPCVNPVISYVHKNNCIKHTQIKMSKHEIENILDSPVKIENTESPCGSIAELVNENEELLPPIDDMAFTIDPVEPENMFGLENFDLENTDMLS